MRFITREIETPLARLIIKGDILPGQLVTVDLIDNQLNFQAKDTVVTEN